MPKIFTTILFFALQCFVVYSQESDDKKKLNYFDQYNKPISKAQYRRQFDRGIYLNSGDSANSKKLTLRENRGQIKDAVALYSLLEKETTQKLNRAKPLVIIYHPGIDACNSSGTTDRSWISNTYTELEGRIEAIANVKPLYIFKENAGLERYKGILTWHKDPDKIIEKTFFKQHYPCSSFVVISSTGKYISYFGEFPKEFVWKAVKALSK